jgi:cytochrome c553/WD40 repeat protein
MKAVLLALAVFFLAAPVYAAEDAAALFTQHCAACHGGDRLGAIGPALLPENLGRLKKGEAEKVIAEGRPATQMPAHAEKLSPEQIKALADYVFTPLASIPKWGMEEITASRVLHVEPSSLPAEPQWKTDPLNLFVVVETGDHHVTVLDGDALKPLARFQSRFALHGGAKYSPDGRFVYFASRDGWISKYDLYSLQVVAEVRAGVNTRNVAVSHDGRFLMVGNMLPHTLVALDARDLSPIRVIEVSDGKGHSSRVSAVYTVPERKAFVAALKDIKEVWELPYNEDHEPIYNGFVHNRQPGMAEGFAEKGPFPMRRIHTSDYLDDFFFDRGNRNLMGASRDGGKGLVINLVTGTEIAQIDLPGMPHLGSGIIFEKDGRDYMATPHLKEAVISIIDMKTWKTVKRIPTLGPGFFMRSHEASPYAWIDVSMGKDKDAIQIIDLRSLEIVNTLRPAPGRTTAHAEFDRWGRKVLISVMEDQGELIVFDAATFGEIKRLPMRRPVGKYNVFNKINYSSGTSH